MAGFNFQLNTAKSDSKAARIFGNVFLFIFAIPFAGFGLFATWGAIMPLRKGEVAGGLVFLLFGLLFGGIGFGLMYAAITAERRRKAAEEKWRAQTDGGQKAWLAREDWAAGKIKSGGAAFLKLFLPIAVGVFAFGSIFSFAYLKDGFPNGNHETLFVLFLPGVGLLFLSLGIIMLRAQRRFGDCFFELAQVPAPLGGSLDGIIQTSKPLKLENTLRLQLSCIRRTVSGSGKNSHTNDEILWEDEKVFRHDASLPFTNAGGTGIPVHFDLPNDQPESLFRGNSTVIWQLVAQSKMRGPDFGVTFEVPVFRVAGATHEKEADPTKSLQASAEEVRQEEHSKIQVADGPGGREFYFPAARNIGMALLVTFITFVWSGFVWFMIVKRAPILFPIVFGFFGIFLLWGTFSAWFRSDRVTVNSTEVTARTRWLIFSRTRRYNAGDVAQFAIKLGAATSGTKKFHDIKLVLRGNDRDSFAARKEKFRQTGERPPLNFKITDLEGPTMAGYIPSKAETEWLIHEMTRALGRKI